MIDPSRITNYNLSNSELEEHILFWLAAAGKNGTTAARLLNKLLDNIDGLEKPFRALRNYTKEELPHLLKLHGIGCYTGKGRTVHELIHSNLNLKTCTAEQLESIFGIGMKTSRCFLIHSREDAKYAGLDTHVLKFLRAKGHDTPKSTPSSRKQYLLLEKIFLTYAEESGMMVPEFDLQIWNKYKIASKEN